MRIASLAISAALALVWAASASASGIGQIKVVKGSALVERAGERQPAKVGMTVQESDVLMTGADGAVGITFADNSLLSAGPNSFLVLSKYRFNSTTHAGEFDATLKKGTLGVVSGKMVKQSPDAMKIRTPASIMGVRGTEFVVKVDEAL